MEKGDSTFFSSKGKKVKRKDFQKREREKGTAALLSHATFNVNKSSRSKR